MLLRRSPITRQYAWGEKEEATLQSSSTVVETPWSRRDARLSLPTAQVTDTHKFTLKSMCVINLAQVHVSGLGSAENFEIIDATDDVDRGVQYSPRIFSETDCVQNLQVSTRLFPPTLSSWPEEDREQRSTCLLPWRLPRPHPVTSTLLPKFRSTSRRKRTAQRFPESRSRPLAASTRLLKFTSMSKILQVAPNLRTEIHRSTFAPVHFQVDFPVTTRTSQTTGAAGSLAWERQNRVTLRLSQLGTVRAKRTISTQDAGAHSPHTFPPSAPSGSAARVGCHNRCHSSQAQ